MMIADFKSLKLTDFSSHITTVIKNAGIGFKPSSATYVYTVLTSKGYRKKALGSARPLLQLKEIKEAKRGGLIFVFVQDPGGIVNQSFSELDVPLSDLKGHIKGGAEAMDTLLAHAINKTKSDEPAKEGMSDYSDVPDFAMYS